MKKILQPILGDYDSKIFYPLVIVFSAVFILIGVDKEAFRAVFDGINKWLIFNFNWGFQFFGTFIALFVFYLAMCKYGDVKLGKPTDEPEFSTFAWIAMMFSAGFGVTTWTWCAAEPIYHLYTSNIIQQADLVGKPEGIKMALGSTFMDWIWHGWCWFTVAGLAIALPAYRKDKPMNLAGGLYGLMGDKAYSSIWGKLADFFGAFAAIGATATPIALGIGLIVSGFDKVFGIELGLPGKILILVAMVVAFVSSAMSGVKRGIKVLSVINISLSMVLFLVLLVIGPTNFIISTIGEAFAWSINNFLELSLYSDVGTFAMNEAGNPTKWAPGGWQNWWLVFYILWWAGYATFCGGFTARISRGRTVREFVLGSILGPGFITLLLFGIMGAISAHAEVTGLAPMWETVQNDFGAATYVILESMPWGSVTMAFVMASAAVYGVTTYDSTSYFIAMQVSGGNPNPPLVQRALWGSVVGVMGLTFLIIGDFNAIKGLSIVAGTPFFFFLMAYIPSIMKMLKMSKNGEM